MPREGRRQFLFREERQERERRPGGGLGQEVGLVVVRNRVGDQPLDAADDAPLGEPVHEQDDGVGRLVAEHRLGRLHPEAAVFHVVDHPPAGREPQLQRKAGGELREEAVERADPHPVQVPRSIARGRSASRLPERRIADEGRQFPEVFLSQPGPGQPQKDPLRDLPARLTGEGRRQNPIRRRLPEPRDVLVRELETSSPEPAEARMIQCRGADWTSTACFGATEGSPETDCSVPADVVPWDALEPEDERESSDRLPPAQSRPQIQADSSHLAPRDEPAIRGFKGSAAASVMPGLEFGPGLATPTASSSRGARGRPPLRLALQPAHRIRQDRAAWVSLCPPGPVHELGVVLGKLERRRHLLVGEGPVAVFVVEVPEPSWRKTRIGFFGVLRIRA